MVSKKVFSVEFGRAIAWTVLYVFFMWCVLYYLFNFDMLSMAHWVRLRSVELHGFPGLVFGLLILAAVPLYVATTVLTLRNKLTPIKIPLPKCFEPAPKKEEPVPEPVVVAQEALPPVRPGVPAEMRESFMRARKNYGARQMSVFNKPMMQDDKDGLNSVQNSIAVAETNVVHNMATEMAESMPMDDTANAMFPIPTDFDVEPAGDEDYGIPVFSDVVFDDDSETDGTGPVDNLCEFLAGAGYSPNKMDNGLIIVNDLVIAVHDDDDFWVADDVNWFAAGKQRPSPIVELNAACSENAALHPVLYLGQKNIMDIDAQIEKWRAAGIEIITDRDELLNRIKPASE